MQNRKQNIVQYSYFDIRVIRCNDNPFIYIHNSACSSNCIPEFKYCAFFIYYGICDCAFHTILFLIPADLRHFFHYYHNLRIFLQLFFLLVHFQHMYIYNYLLYFIALQKSAAALGKLPCTFLFMFRTDIFFTLTKYFYQIKVRYNQPFREIQSPLSSFSFRTPFITSLPVILRNPFLSSGHQI